MKGDDIALASNGGQVHKSGFTLIGTRRVVQQHPHTQGFCHLCYTATDMAYSYHTQGRMLQVQSFLLLQKQKNHTDILLHRTGIAARAIVPRNARLATILHVDVVVTNGGRSNELHTTSFQQLPVTTGTGTHNQGVGILYRLFGKGIARQINYLIGYISNSLLYVRYFMVYYYFHIFQFSL